MEKISISELVEAFESLRYAINVDDYIMAWEDKFLIAMKSLYNIEREVDELMFDKMRAFIKDREDMIERDYKHRLIKLTVEINVHYTKILERSL